MVMFLDNNAVFLKNIFQFCREELTQCGVNNPELDSELLLAHALKIPRQKLWLQKDREVDLDTFEIIKDLITRRKAREPMAYILGKKEFWSLDFEVNSSVLIPRPETEILVEHFLKILKEQIKLKDPKVLDLGTGSGTLAITVAKECPNSNVVAVDISKKALEVAKQNALNHNVPQIHFVLGDVLGEWDFVNNNFFDFILSNPPYIPSDNILNLMPEIADWEPGLALDGGESGLDFYYHIISKSPNFLNQGGALIMEVGDGQAQMVGNLLKLNNNFEKPLVLKDYSGCDRVVSSFRR